MKKAISKFSMEDMWRKLILRFHPELEGRQLEFDFRSDVECPECELNKARGLFYRIDQGEWVLYGERNLCKACEDRESVRRILAKGKEQQRIDLKERLEKEYFLIPENLQMAGFKNYEVLDSVTGKAKEHSMDYVKKFLEGERFNLLIQGSPGTGKSHLCAAIARTIRGSVRKMRIYNVKEISILKSLISQLTVKKLGFFHVRPAWV